MSHQPLAESSPRAAATSPSVLGVSSGIGLHSFADGEELSHACELPELGWRTSKLKRTLDVVGAGAGLILLSPILGVAAAVILAIDGSPVLFRQQRAGLHGRPFDIVKFRTMRPGADDLRSHLRSRNEVTGGAFKMSGDPRVTRLGRWMRRMSVDELPQLWNVLKGEMSLVGPRPHPYDDVARYKAWHFARLSAKPGMTGLWQIELRDDPDFDRWVEKDIEYIQRWSIWLDLTVMWRTIPAVIRGTGR